MNYKMKSKEIEEDTNLRVECPYCKRKNYMPVFVDERICYWCKKKIKNNTKSYFIYKLRKEIKNNG